MLQTLHELTWTFRKAKVPGMTLGERLGKDVKDLKKIFTNTGYTEEEVDCQLQELINQNKAAWRSTGKTKKDLS